MQRRLIHTNYLLTHFSKLLAINLGWLFIISTFNPAYAQAQSPFQLQVTQAIQAFMDEKAQQLAAQEQGKLSYDIRGLDPRLQLKLCQTPPSVDAVQHNWLRQRTHVKIRCTSPEWSFLVGLQLQLVRKVFVATTAIERNTSLSDNIELDERNILDNRHGYIEHRASLTGKVAKRNLTPGQTISPHLIKAQVLIPRNSVVAISAHIGTIAVTSSGIALENGAFGDVIKIRNQRSKKIIEARVVQANKVEINL